MAALPPLRVRRARGGDMRVRRLYEQHVQSTRIAFVHDTQLVKEHDVTMLIEAMTDHHMPPAVDGSLCVRYDGYMSARALLPPPVVSLLTPRLFMTLMIIDDAHGRTRVTDIVDYVTRCAWLDQYMLTLSIYDTDNDGCLTPSDLDAYIDNMIATVPALQAIDTNFRPFYKCVCSRKLLFFLDTQRQESVRIDDILVSGFLDDLLQLTTADADDGKATNWFSMTSAQRIYGQYVNLDVDHDGLLNKEELKEYSNGSLTTTFLDALFDRYAVYDGGKMDFKAFVDFVLAMENKEDRAAINYFMRALCIFAVGRLDAQTIAHFFGDIAVSIEHLEGVTINATDIIDEIYDMCRPHDPLFITVDELVDSKQGGTIVDILTDVDAFWRYDNRETLADEDDNEDGQQHVNDTPRIT